MILQANKLPWRQKEYKVSFYKMPVGRKKGRQLFKSWQPSASCYKR